MNKIDIENRLNLSDVFIPDGKRNRRGIQISPTSITIHNTGNVSKGADALAHSRFVTKKGFNTYKGKKSWVSWHFTVDDNRVVKHLPINEFALHAGPSANSSSIAIENCMNEGIDFELARDRLVVLVATLMHDMHFSIGQIKTHKDWTGKACPILILDEWAQFLNEVEKAYKSIDSVDKVLVSLDELSYEQIESADESDNILIDGEIHHDEMREDLVEFINN